MKKTLRSAVFLTFMVVFGDCNNGKLKTVTTQPITNFNPVLEIGMNLEEKNHRRHCLLTYILMVPIAIFLLFSVATRLNHIYCGIISLFTGAIATLYCRPDLKGKIWIGALLFTLLYFFYFGSILLFFPGYVKTHWNLPALSGVIIRGIPLEELFFAFTFGMYWSGLYEHIKWNRIVKNKIDQLNAYAY